MAMSSPLSSPQRRAPARVLALVIATTGLLPWLAPTAQTADQAPPGADPEQTLRDYYKAVSSGDCELAAALRPGYGEQSCRESLVAELGKIETLRVKNERAAMFISVEVQKKEGPALFSGFVGLRRCAGRWLIMTNSFESLKDGEAEQRERYADDLVGGRRDSLTHCPTPGPVQTASGAAASRPAAPRPRTDVPTPIQGSAPLLKRCWEDLTARVGEEKVRPADSGPDAQPPLLDTRTASGMRTPSQPPYHSIRRVRVSEGRNPAVALTFNLIERPGEVSGYDGDLVDVLRRKRTPATFFASGRWMRSHPERVQQLLADPLFELGSLGWDHRNLAVADADEIERQLLWTEATYRELRDDLAAHPCAAELQQELSLIPPLPLLVRFPYGRCDELALQTVEALGNASIQWSLVMDDIARDSTAGGILDRVRSEIDPNGPGSGSGAILVGHADGRGHGTAIALPEIIDELRDRDYELVTVSELLARGTPVWAPTCYEHLPGDNLIYDEKFSD